MNTWTILFTCFGRLEAYNLNGSRPSFYARISNAELKCHSGNALERYHSFHPESLSYTNLNFCWPVGKSVNCFHSVTVVGIYCLKYSFDQSCFSRIFQLTAKTAVKSPKGVWLNGVFENWCRPVVTETYTQHIIQATISPREDKYVRLG